MNADDHIRLSMELGDDVIFLPIFVNLASPTDTVLFRKFADSFEKL